MQDHWMTIDVLLFAVIAFVLVVACFSGMIMMGFYLGQKSLKNVLVGSGVQKIEVVPQSWDEDPYLRALETPTKEEVIVQTMKGEADK